MSPPSQPVIIDVDLAEIPALKGAMRAGGIRPFRTVERRRSRATLEVANDTEAVVAKLHAPSIKRA